MSHNFTYHIEQIEQTQFDRQIFPADGIYLLKRITLIILFRIIGKFFQPPNDLRGKFAPVDHKKLCCFKIFCRTDLNISGFFKPPLHCRKSPVIAECFQKLPQMSPVFFFDNDFAGKDIFGDDCSVGTDFTHHPQNDFTVAPAIYRSGKTQTPLIITV